MRLSQLSSDEFDERVAQLDLSTPTRAGPNTYLSTPSNGNDDDSLELALNLSCLPVDIFDEQVGELNLQEARPSVEDVLAMFLARISNSVRTPHFPCVPSDY